ncbi:MAG: hypothetical protein AAF193_08140, partial [Bacteroidota bacterium]
MKVLIASYHFPPFNVAASNRALGWANYLPEAGVDTTVVTANHPGEKVATNAEVIYLDIPSVPSQMSPHWTNDIPGASKIKTTIQHLQGELDPQAQGASEVFKNWLFEHLKHHQYDYYIGIFSPHFHIEHAYLLHREFGLKYVIDFRDLFDNRYSMPNPVISVKHRVLYEIILQKWKKWMSGASGWITVGQSLAMTLQNWFEKPGECIINGVEVQEYQSFPEKTFDQFTVLYTGRIYSNQDLTIVFRAWQRFVEGKSNVQLMFL